MTLEEFNWLNKSHATDELLKCCGSTTWAESLLKNFPFKSEEELLKKSDEAWSKCAISDYLEAFLHHPKIGTKKDAESKSEDSKRWASHEQSGVKDSPANILNELEEMNNKYFEKFGYIFIVCATGKSAMEMLSILKERINNEPEKELQIAAGEQNKITHIRITKLLT